MLKQKLRLHRLYVEVKDLCYHVIACKTWLPMHDVTVIVQVADFERTTTLLTDVTT